MSRTFRALILMALLGSCGSYGDKGSAPNDLDNACSLLNERPSYLPAFKAAERKYGVPIATMMAMIYQESKFIADARTPFQYKLGVIPVGRQSSAFGYSQALDGTWKEYKQKTGKSRARRDRLRDATDFMGWYMTNTRNVNGIALNDTRNQYLAYHDGNTGFRRGTYKKKPWLVRIAGEIDRRAIMYDAQLRACRKI